MNLKVEINKIKNLDKCKFELPIEKGIYCIVGANGSGKSTVLSCVAQTVFASSLQALNEYDYDETSYIKFEYSNLNTVWQPREANWFSTTPIEKRVRFNGMYEGSLFYGTRFNDSLVIDKLVKDGYVSADSIVDADAYVKQKLSYILHGNYNYYLSLKRIRNKKIARNAHLKNTPYFQEVNGHLISQYRMSSGECLLISLLHFVYNALIRRSLPTVQPILMLIDEIELALHPVAVSRLIDLLNEIIKEHNNLTVVLTSHSPEVIRKISPNNLFMMETNEEGIIQPTAPCYPSYAIRDVYMHDGFDYVILVEDLLAKYVVEKVIKQEGLNNGCLINVLPIGGWENVLKFQNEAYHTNTFGIGTNVFSILDGDVMGNIKKEYKNFPKTFLPISSIEKYLHKVITTPSLNKIKKEINDSFFMVESLDDLLADYYSEGDNNGKSLYRKLLKNLENRGISEEAFVKELCDVIMRYENFASFATELKTKISKT